MLITFNLTKDLIYVLFFMFINLFLLYIKTDYSYFKIKFESMSHICDGCLIIFYIFEKYLLKGNNNKNEFCIKINKISYKMIILFILSIILICINNYHFINFNDEKTNLIEIPDLITTIIFLILIEVLFFNKTFYRHQILSFNVIMLFYIYIIVYKYIKSSLTLSYFLAILQ